MLTNKGSRYTEGVAKTSLTVFVFLEKMWYCMVSEENQHAFLKIRSGVCGSVKFLLLSVIQSMSRRATHSFICSQSVYF
jgi:hypothetical protein